MQELGLSQSHRLIRYACDNRFGLTVDRAYCIRQVLRHLIARQYPYAVACADTRHTIPVLGADFQSP